MASKLYSDYERTIIGRIQGLLDREYLKGKTSSEIAEQIYLAWSKITDTSEAHAADYFHKKPERY